MYNVVASEWFATFSSNLYDYMVPIGPYQWNCNFWTSTVNAEFDAACLEDLSDKDAWQVWGISDCIPMPELLSFWDGPCICW